MKVGSIIWIGKNNMRYIPGFYTVVQYETGFNLNILVERKCYISNDSDMTWVLQGIYESYFVEYPNSFKEIS